MLGTKQAVTIHAPAEKVWDALTKPELIKQWFFGVDTETDWKVGSSLVHKGEWQGKPYEDKGKVLKVSPPRLLAHTHWSPTSDVPDIAENYQTVTYTLSERNGETELTISEVNFPSEEAKQLSEQSWQTVLNSLKEMLEREPIRQ